MLLGESRICQTILGLCPVPNIKGQDHHGEEDGVNNGASMEAKHGKLQINNRWERVAKQACRGCRLQSKLELQDRCRLQAAGMDGQRKQRICRLNFPFASRSPLAELPQAMQVDPTLRKSGNPNFVEKPKGEENYRQKQRQDRSFLPSDLEHFHEVD